MPPIRIELHPDAAADAEEAASWYAERSALAARGFLAELDLVLSRVLEAPDRWPQFEMGTRRYVFPRYPFNLIYRIKGGDVEVLAVAHQRRRHDYWKRRQ
jgi:toxin ParE1/3/4